jgi:hypothetical protein
MRRIVGLAAALVFLAGAAQAAPYLSPLGVAVKGPVYFWKPGANLAAHDADIDACRDLALGAYAPLVAAAPTTGVLDGMIAGEMQNQGIQHAAKQTLQASIENCMVIRGWSVVRLEFRKGEALAKLSPGALSRAIERRLLAAEPEGEIVRGGFDRFDLLKPRVALSIDQRRESLSVASRGELPFTRVIASPPGGPIAPLVPADKAQLGQDATVIVLKVSTTAPRTIGVRLLRLDDSGDAGAEVHFILARNLSRLFWKKGERFEQTLVFEVPPGRWALAGDADVTSFCLGAPAFEVRPGEVVFAGHFDGATARPLTPDLSVGAVQPDLPAAIADRLKPATYVNGSTWQCSRLTSYALYAYEIEGAPFEEGYAFGSLAWKR